MGSVLFWLHIARKRLTLRDWPGLKLNLLHCRVTKTANLLPLLRHLKYVMMNGMFYWYRENCAGHKFCQQITAALFSLVLRITQIFTTSTRIVSYKRTSEIIWFLQFLIGIRGQNYTFSFMLFMSVEWLFSPNNSSLIIICIMTVFSASRPTI